MHTGDERRGGIPDALRVRGPGDLVQAVPYLLGFHPQRSLVLVGLAQARVVVTARLDLDDLSRQDRDRASLLGDAVSAMVRGGSREVVAIVFADGRGTGSALPWQAVVEAVQAAAGGLGCGLADALLAADGRWWSYACSGPQCCPAAGRPLAPAASEFAAAATYAGLVALPDRATLAATLDPLPPARRALLLPALREHEQDAVAALVRGEAGHLRRRGAAALLSAAADWDEPDAARRADGLADTRVAEFGSALRDTEVRDAVWLALDAGVGARGRLWAELGRRLPPPYDAAPLFLFGWSQWRAGNGALAGIALERALVSDPAYRAADLLLTALQRGLNPGQMPPLRLPRPA